MRVTSIDIYGSNSSLVATMSFRDPTSSLPYVAKNITGLDADEILPKFYGTDLGNMKYYDLSVTKRDVVMQIGLNPNFGSGQSYASLRDALYKVISASRTGKVEIRFKDGDTVKAALSGFVTKFESPNFTQSPEVTITVNCSDPRLKAVEETNVDISEFDPDSFTVVDNVSTAPHGFRFGVIFTGETTDFSVQDAETANWAFEVGLTGSPLESFFVDDELHFSSDTNNRYLYLVRAFEVIHLVDRIIPTSIWPILFPGDNNFMFSDMLDLDYITHYPTYWGV